MNDFTLRLTFHEDLSRAQKVETAEKLKNALDLEGFRVINLNIRSGSTIFEFLLNVLQEPMVIASISSGAIFVLKKIAGTEINTFYTKYVRPKLMKNNKELPSPNFQEVVDSTTEFYPVMPISDANKLLLESPKLREVMRELSKEFGEVDVVLQARKDNMSYELRWKSVIDSEKEKEFRIESFTMHTERRFEI